MDFSNYQGHQPITGQGRILCKLENCFCETSNQIKTERDYTIELPTSQQLKLHIKSSWKCALEQFNKTTMTMTSNCKTSLHTESTTAVRPAF